MLGITRRDYWSFCCGFSFMGLFLGFVAHAPSLFLFSALFFAADVAFYLSCREAK